MCNRRLIYWLTAFLLLVALVLSVSVAYARYREELIGDFGIQAKPLEPVSFTKETWTRTEDSLELAFSVGQVESGFRIYLAMSEGFTDMEKVSVSLAIPNEAMTQLPATGEKIQPASGIYHLFGDGHVFRFLDVQTGQELFVELQPDVTYVLTISGLEDAAEHTGLVRLFVEYAED